MTQVERYVYDLVKSKPWLKDFLRNVYQSVFDMLPRKKDWFASEFQYKEHFFLGFHDVQPFSPDGTKLIAQHADIEGHMPLESDALHVGYFDFTNGQLGGFHPIADSYAWNFHKGCRLQWIDDTHILFNTRAKDKPFAVIYDIVQQKSLELPYPIDSVCTGGKVATTQSYERLEYLMPGYGYKYTKDEGYCEDNAPTQTGLFLLDLQTHKRTLLFSIADMQNDVTDVYPSAKQAFHYITHSSFSTDGRYIACLHRFVQLSDLDARTTRLVIYDTTTKKRFTLPTEGMVSHYAWNTNNQIVAYCRINGMDRHALFTIKDGQCVAAHPIAHDKINSDGHQSWLNARAFVTDTYPDKYRMAKLFIVDCENNDIKPLASIYSPKAFQTKNMYNHIACDLHPRCSRNGEYVCFDSPRTGVRSLYLLKVN